MTVPTVAGRRSLQSANINRAPALTPPTEPTRKGKRPRREIHQLNHVPSLNSCLTSPWSSWSLTQQFILADHSLLPCISLHFLLNIPLNSSKNKQLVCESCMLYKFLFCLWWCPTENARMVAYRFIPEPCSSLAWDEFVNKCRFKLLCLWCDSLGLSLIL